MDRFSDLFSGFGAGEDEPGTGEEFGQFGSGGGRGSDPESSDGPVGYIGFGGEVQSGLLELF